jgi:hypothetical protein
VSAATPDTTARKPAPPPAHWGRALRTILISPRNGFAKALRLSRSDEGRGGRKVLVPILSALGGAYLLLMFLKVRGLTGFRDITPSEFDWAPFTLALVVAALSGVLAHYLFGFAATPAASRLGRRCEPQDLRTVWGLAGFPVAVAFLLLLVLDIAIAGREAYSSVEDNSLITGWSAGSLTVGLSLGLWSLYLFVKGLAVAAQTRISRSLLLVVVATLCLAIAAYVATRVVYGIGMATGLIVDLIQAVSK